MGKGKTFGSASVLGLSAMLAGCGDSTGSGVTQIPPPPPSYTKLANLTGTQTFQSGGVHWQASASGITGQGTDAFGSGVSIVYDTVAGNYTINAPGGVTATFTPADNDPTVTNGNTHGYIKTTSSGQQSLSVTLPSIGGVALNYTMLGFFLNANTTSSQAWSAVGGVPTIASDMPKTGTASYNAATGADIVNTSGVYLSNSASTATFSANFGTGAITTAVHLVGALQGGGAAIDFGTFNGTGTISSGGPGFTGSFTGTTGAGFSGAFFGPQATEMGYSYNFISGGNQAFGATWGVKQ